MNRRNLREVWPALGSTAGALLGGACGTLADSGWIFAAAALAGAVGGCLVAVWLQRTRDNVRERRIAQSAGAAGGALAGTVAGAVAGPIGILSGSALGAAIGEKVGRGIADKQVGDPHSPKGDRELAEAAGAAGGAVAGAAIGSVAGPAGAAAGARLGALVGHEAGQEVAQKRRQQ